MSSLTEKLSRLAFDPAATEGEAVAAFLALRKQGCAPINPVTSKKMETRKYTVRLPAIALDSYLGCLDSWATKKEPYYLIAGLEKRTKMYEPLRFSLIVTLPEYRMEAFNSFIHVVVDAINRP